MKIPSPQPDFVLDVQKVPNGALAQMVSLIARVDATGRIAACEPSPFSRKEAKLAEVACTQTKSLSLDIAKDNDGNPISLIRSFSVLFRAATSHQ